MHPFRFLLLAALGLLTASVPAAGAQELRTSTHLVVADAHAESERPGSRLGRSRIMRVGRPAKARAYLRFRVRIPGPARRATLRLGFAAPTPALLQVRVATANWTERGLRWGTAPGAGPPVATVKLSGDGTTAVDVTRLVRRSGTLSLALTTTGGEVQISAREHAGGAARLEVSAASEDPQPAAPLRTAIYRPADVPQARTLGDARALGYGRFEVAAVRWDRRGGPLHRRLGAMLDALAWGDDPLRVVVLHTGDVGRDPSVAQLRRDLQAIDHPYGRHRAYGRIRGRPVVFVDADRRDGCEMLRRWRLANTVEAHLVVRAVHGYRRCADKPADWWPGRPSGSRTARAGRSFAIRPLPRGVEAFRHAVRRMVRSRARWQVVSSFNDGRDAVASAPAWASMTGRGTYLDVLHDPSRKPPEPPLGERLVAAAGDVACEPGDRVTPTACRHGFTSDLLLNRPYEAVLVLGDTQYEAGALHEFRDSFAPTWGRAGDRLRPVIGNHEYVTPGGAGYWDYFNGEGVPSGRAGTRGKGWYAFDVGAWRVIALNSNCGYVRCAAGSEQLAWLREELRRNPRRCTLAYLHHPLFSSGRHGGIPEVRPMVDELHADGLDVLLAGHDHNYERFAEQTPAGIADPRGFREFVVGTGGINLRPIPLVAPNSEARNAEAFGILELRLGADGYAWDFRAAEGSAFADRGSGDCD